MTQTQNLPAIFDEVVKRITYKGTIPAAPFSGGGFTYSTDGKLCVRAEGELAETNAFASKPADLPWSHDAYRDPVALPPIETVQAMKRPCPKCGGEGTVTEVECPTCEGDGNVELYTSGGDYWGECQCRECSGDGTVELDGTEEKTCPDCDGEKSKYPDDVGVNLGPVHLSPLNVDLLIRHGIRSVRPSIKSPASRPVLAIGDGWEALVMPTSRPAPAADAEGK